MNSTNKKPHLQRAIPQRFNRQIRHASPVAAQLKTAVFAQGNKPPVAPPVYRPQPTPKVLQTKKALIGQPQPAIKTRELIIQRLPADGGKQLRPQTAQTTPSINRMKQVAQLTALPHVQRPSQKPSTTPGIPVRVRTAGTVQRQTAGSKSFETAASKPNRLPVPAKPITAAVAIKRSNLIQRRIRVTNIDYNPVENQFRHGNIDQAQFLQDLRAEINNVARYALFRNQVANVIGAVNATANLDGGILGADITALTTAVADQVVNEYSNRGLAGIVAQRPHLEQAITRLLVANVQVAHDVNMNAGESVAYDQLRAIVTDAHMSRAKQATSALNYAQLPPVVKNGVDTILNHIRAERKIWRDIGIRSLNIKYFLPAPNEEFAVEVINRCRTDRRYQGNHANAALWLPPVAAPASHIETAQAAILAAASPGLTAILNTYGNALATLQIQKGMQPTAFGLEFIGLVSAQRRARTTQQLVDSVGAALAQGVSGYVEFSMAGDISRLVWDVVNNRVYVSAHYKWRLGYNPWFRIDNLAAPL